MTDKGVAIAGLGTIGRELATWLSTGGHGLALKAVSSGNDEKAADWLNGAGITVPVVPAGALPDYAEVIVEAAPPTEFEDIARPALEAGRTLIVLTSSALLVHDDLILLAAERGGRIIVPSGWASMPLWRPRKARSRASRW